MTTPWLTIIVKLFFTSRTLQPKDRLCYRKVLSLKDLAMGFNAESVTDHKKKEMDGQKDGAREAVGDTDSPHLNK